MDEHVFFSANPWRTGGFALPVGTVPRDIQANALKLLLKGHEILALLGLRQTGKSTLTFQLIDHLLRREQAAPGRIFYFTFDDLSLRQELSASFGNFLKVVERFLGGEVRGRKDPVYVFIDEVQKLPGFVEYIKMLYDLRLPIRWVLTGSSSLTLKSQVKESLAGRVVQLPVFPFSEHELFLGHGDPPPDKTAVREFLFESRFPDKRALRKIQAELLPSKHRIGTLLEEVLVFGSLPAVALSRDVERKKLLLKNYRDTYLDQDIRNLVREDKLWVYQKVMELLGGRIGDLLNYSAIAAQIEVTVDTIKRYALLLEKTFVLRTFTTCSRNVRAEVLKTPKIYFTDLGLRNALLGLDDLSRIENLGQSGVVLENVLVERLLSVIAREGYGTRLHYWRTRAKEEVDIVLAGPTGLLPIEVKYDRKIRPRHLNGIKAFLEKEKEHVGIVVGRWDEAEIIEDGKFRIYLIPHWFV
ncbi:MAG: ATP-binding protein [Deltaproteobacteria bacterium]|nr:ATP-binding protein [Deltaproteobacteria bacterium]